MPCTCTVKLTEIVHTGADIGDDWSYSVSIEGTTVAMEGIGSGEPRERIPFDPPYAWIIEVADCDIVSLDVQVKAKEQDLFFSDKGEKVRTLTVTCPEPGEGPNRFENQQVVARVTEQPFLNKLVHWVTFVFDLETVCHGG